MTTGSHAPRVLALNERAGFLGYAVFEGPKQLLDWGTRALPAVQSTRSESRRERIASLFVTSSAQAVVVHRARYKRDVNSRRLQSTTRIIVIEASTRSIPLTFVDRREVRDAFGIFDAANKYQRAAALVGIFPELVWKLPPTRKKWQSEPRAMLVFDAIAAGFSYWQKVGCQDPMPNGRMPLSPW